VTQISFSYSTTIWTAASVLFLSLLLVSLLLVSLIPLGFDSYGIVKTIKGIGVNLADYLGSAIIKLEEHFWFYIPLGTIGIWRWLVWGVKKTGAAFYKPISEDTFNSNLSIVTPVYDENPETFNLALRSWDRNNPDEIIAVIDERDKDCIKVFQNFCKSRSWAKLIVTSKPGKRQALAEGILKAKSEIVALVDSDTIWDLKIKEKLLAPFSNPAIGGVTPRNHPVKRQTIWEKMNDVFWDMRNYYDLPSQTAMGSALTCLTGRTSLYRRDILLPRLDEFLNEILLGKRKESGEDKCLTRIIQRDGWKTYYQSTAVINSVAASDFRTFIMQRLRWTRNSHNSDLVSLLDGWAWRHPYLAFYMIDRFISTFTLFLGPIFLGMSIYYHQFTVTIAILALWLVGRGIKILPHLRRRPEDVPLVPIFVAVNFLMALIKLYALITIREQKWIREHYQLKGVVHKTRQKVIAKIKDMILTTEIIASMVILVVYVFR
jgi:cellulose synthase/poly-beta-1,6-N-acetylglucosamine synthase-like glycosyltransferase